MRSIVDNRDVLQFPWFRVIELIARSHSFVIYTPTPFRATNCLQPTSRAHLSLWVITAYRFALAPIADVYRRCAVEIEVPCGQKDTSLRTSTLSRNAACPSCLGSYPHTLGSR